MEPGRVAVSRRGGRDDDLSGGGFGEGGAHDADGCVAVEPAFEGDRALVEEHGEAVGNAGAGWRQPQPGSRRL